MLTPEQVRARAKIRMARKKSSAYKALRNSLSRYTKRQLIKKHRKCAFCGKKSDLTIDHILPLARGGTNAEKNLQVLCSTCNGKKGSDLPRKTRK